jgi:hypothetical protein
MVNSGPAVFKYKSEGGGSGWLVLLLIVSLIISVVAAANLSAWFAWGLLIPLAIMIHLIRSSSAKGLFIGPRFLIAGDAIIYYANVSKATLDRQRQILTLVSEQGKRLVIEGERFPTNARKAEKIKINKTAKFEKVSEKVLQRLKGVTPEVIG